MSDELNEVWELYAEEGNHSLDEAENILLKLQKGVTDSSAIAALFRALHTFKGNARVMALSVIESRAHLAEDLIGLVRDEGVELDASMLALLLETVDVLRGMLECSLYDRSDVKQEPSESLAERLKLEYAMRRGQGGSADTVKTPTPILIPMPDDPEWPETVTPEKQEQVESPAENAGEEDDDDGVHAILFDDDEGEQPRLADDPLYRQIFAEMAFSFLSALRTALSDSATDTLSVTTQLASEAERLAHAASQMGLPEWESSLNDYLAMDFPGQAEVMAALEQFTGMARADFSAFEPDVDAHASESLQPAGYPYTQQALQFLTAIKSPLSELSGLRYGLGTDQRVDHRPGRRVGDTPGPRRGQRFSRACRRTRKLSCRPGRNGFQAGCVSCHGIRALRITGFDPATGTGGCRGFTTGSGSHSATLLR